MVSSNLSAYHFDRVTEKFANKSRPPKSVDGLIITDKNAQILIEFKNGKINNNTKSEIRCKISSSILTITHITGNKITEFKNKSKFILVYNKDKNGDIVLGTLINKDAKNNENKDIDLEYYKDKYFEKVKLLNVSEFENLLNSAQKNGWDFAYSEI
ncbi:MAG: hypothetical protein J6M21_04070 [Campylobacter sp.]|nr:hypothetical protein [Campylobacter sp.]